MARDYARNKTQKKRSKEKGNGGLWIFSLVLTGLFVLGLMYLKNQNLKLDTQQAQKITVPAQEKNHGAPLYKRTPHSNPVSNTLQPNLDFYTLLPKAVPDHQTTAKNTVVQQPVASAVGAQNSSYRLQLGVFNNYAAADELKAQVTLQGFEAVISTFKKDEAVFYSVSMGPFKSRALAVQQQRALAENQIKSTLSST